MWGAARFESSDTDYGAALSVFKARPYPSRNKNVVRLESLICVATITLDDKEPGNHTLATPSTMRAMGPSWL